MSLFTSFDYMKIESRGSSKPKSEKQKLNVAAAMDLAQIQKRWKDNGITSSCVHPALLKKLKSLYLKDGMTLEKVFIAIENYSKSEWHVENKCWKSLFGFLEPEFINKWQHEAEPRKTNKFYVKEEDIERLKNDANDISNLIAKILGPKNGARQTNGSN